MYLLLSLLFVSVSSAPDGNAYSSINDNLLVEHSVTPESANNAIQHLVPDLSKIDFKSYGMYDLNINNYVISDRSWVQRMYHKRN